LKGEKMTDGTDNGWIKLHRNIISDKWLMKNPKRNYTWIMILLLANHKETDGELGGIKIKIKPGQFVTGRKFLASITYNNESTTDQHLKALEKNGYIKQQTTNRNRLITVINWHKYQSVDEDHNNKKRGKKRGNVTPVLTENGKTITHTRRKNKRITQVSSGDTNNSGEIINGLDKKTKNLTPSSSVEKTTATRGLNFLILENNRLESLYSELSDSEFLKAIGITQEEQELLNGFNCTTASDLLNYYNYLKYKMDLDIFETNSEIKKVDLMLTLMPEPFKCSTTIKRMVNWYLKTIKDARGCNLWVSTMSKAVQNKWYDGLRKLQYDMYLDETKAMLTADHLEDEKLKQAQVCREKAILENPNCDILSENKPVEEFNG